MSIATLGGGTKPSPEKPKKKEEPKAEKPAKKETVVSKKGKKGKR